MAKQKEAKDPKVERVAEEPERPLPPTLVSLQDRHGHVALRFLAKEIRRPDGGGLSVIKSGVARVRLSRNAKQIAVWSGYGDQPPTAMITAEGYRALNQIAQITVLVPPSVEIPGVGRVANPHVRLYEETGAFKAGWVRHIGIAPGPTGNMVLTDRTTYLSLVEYLMEDLIGVSKRNPAAVVWGVKEISPAGLLADAIAEANADLLAKAEEWEKKNRGRESWMRKKITPPEVLERAVQKVKRGLWGFYCVEPITGQGLWFDRTAEAVARVFSTYAQSGKFGLRKLTAIGYRNCLRDHPLMPGMSIAPEGLERVMPENGGPDAEPIDVVAELPVFFHQQVEGEAEIKQMVREYEEGLRTAAFTVVGGEEARRPQRASVSDERAEVETDERPREEADAAPAREAGQEGPEEEPDVAPWEGQEAPAPDPRAALLVEAKAAEDAAGPAIVGPLLSKHPAIRRDRSKATEEQIRAYITALVFATRGRDAR